MCEDVALEEHARIGLLIRTPISAVRIITCTSQIWRDQIHWYLHCIPQRGCFAQFDVPRCRAHSGYSAYVWTVVKHSMGDTRCNVHIKDIPWSWVVEGYRLGTADLLTWLPLWPAYCRPSRSQLPAQHACCTQSVKRKDVLV